AVDLRRCRHVHGRVPRRAADRDGGSRAQLRQRAPGAVPRRARWPGRSRGNAPARRKIVLYNPRAVFFTMPLALMAIGSELDPERYEVVIVDGRLEADPEAAVQAQLEGALCLGVTVLTGAPISDALSISRLAKRLRPDLPVVWGGWHPSMFARECLDDDAVDV